jgi:hypothetical protein
MSTNMTPFARRRTIAAVFAATAVAFALAGCSAASSIATETVRGVPAGVTLTDEEQSGEQPVAVWTDNRETLTVVTWGSSSCPPVPTALELEAAMQLNLRFGPPTEQVCTADFAPTSHVFTTPDGISFSAVQLSITFVGTGGQPDTEVTIPVRDNE